MTVVLILFREEIRVQIHEEKTCENTGRSYTADLHAEEKDLRSRPRKHLNLGLPASGTIKISMILRYGSPAN